MIKEPLFIEPKTLREYEQYKHEEARVQGWNEAMECIFAQELEQERRVKEPIKSCWLMKSEGDWLCKTCQNRDRCEVKR